LEIHPAGHDAIASSTQSSSASAPSMTEAFSSSSSKINAEGQVSTQASQPIHSSWLINYFFGHDILLSVV
jgi:hypothetical protein